MVLPRPLAGVVETARNAPLHVQVVGLSALRTRRGSFEHLFELFTDLSQLADGFGCQVEARLSLDRRVVAALLMSQRQERDRDVEGESCFGSDSWFVIASPVSLAMGVGGPA